MSVIYDKASIDDVDELVLLRTAYLTDDFGELSDADRASVKRELPPYLQRHLDRDLSIHIAWDERIVSCAWLLLVEKPPSPRFPHGRTGVLFNVYTAPDHRHQGLASGVMQRLLDEARAMELDVVELHATDDGYPLYCKLGFADDSSTHKPMRLVLR